MLRLLVAMAAGPVVASLVLGLMLRHRHRLPVSVPDHRTLHIGAVPRSGGIALWAGALGALLLGDRAPPWLPALAAMVVVFAIEDWRGLTPGVRLLAQGAGTLAALWSLAAELPAGSGWEGPVWAWVGAAGTILWATNLYNFMDGADGLAGSATVVGFGTLALATLGTDQPDARVGYPAAAIALATVPFLMVNWHPARIFLGDAGAVPLGFAAGALGWDGVVREIWPIWFPVLVFLPFVVDATLTLVRRSAQGHSPLEPHRDHCYQRLVRIGWGHARTAFAYGAAMMTCAGTALAFLHFAPAYGWIALGAAAFALAGIYAIVSGWWHSRGVTG
jgi:UDP-N-acetylmuramyl pentapeptide phosphotransferase/UDP-N-acetylglucosamine-1-phosphate transferase